MDEVQHDDDVGESAFERHLGALYSCSTRTRVHSLSDRREFPSASASSARCLLSTPGEPTMKIHSSDNGALAVEERADSSTTIREVFCRALPLQNSASDGSNSPTRSIPNPNATIDTVSNVNGLREALGRLYDGFHIISSPQPSVAEPKWRSSGEGKDGGGNAEQAENAAQPQRPLEPQLATCARLHAGLVPLYTPLVESEDGFFLLFSCMPFRLTALAQLCRGLRGASGLSPLLSTAGGRRDRNSVDLVVRFVFYQLLRAVEFLHSRGIAVGNLSSSNTLLTRNLWVQIAPSMCSLSDGSTGIMPPSQESQASADADTSLATSPPSSRSPSKNKPTGSSSACLARDETSREQARRQRRSHRARLRRPSAAGGPRRPPGEDLPLTYRWVKGMVSNLEYLLAVNAAAGRVLGDRSCHPIVPWVTDFSERLKEETAGEGRGEKGWRDLMATKFRLKKGDAQLDKSYSEASPPHHIPESLSELTLVVYLARRLPVQVLRDVVRSELVAKEYPSSIAGMYAWTPDECVPEFYTDPGVFRSTHADAGGLPSLEVPPWCDGSPEKFVRYHRSLLEGAHVSRNLHRWLDVTFGYCLKGQAAVENKNVPLCLLGTSAEAGGGAPRGSIAGAITLDATPGFIQLFRHPHPPRSIDAGSSVDDFSTRSSPGAGPARANEGAEATPPLTTVSAALDVAAVASVASAVPRRDRAPVAPTEGATAIAGVRPAAVNGTEAHVGDAAGDPSGGRPGVTSVGGERKGGGASIFGVAFDDYIREDGVCPPGPPAATTALSGGGARQERVVSDGASAAEARASVEEDRRALAFAYDVELILEPWYGRSRSDPVAAESPGNAAAIPDKLPESSSSSSDASPFPPAPSPDGNSGRDVIGTGGSDSASGDGGVASTSRAADLLACGCVLAEMCAGEPVLAGPSFVGRTDSGAGGGGGGGDGRGGLSWLEAAVGVPPALRGAIGALTHPDQSKRPSAQALLSTAERGRHRRRGTASTSRVNNRTGFPPPSSSSSGPASSPALLPSYRGLFPPYMRDVYAFLAALHQEETGNKRLLLAAAALPVLQVPLHAFSLVLPHILALLGALVETDSARMQRNRRRNINIVNRVKKLLDNNGTRQSDSTSAAGMEEGAQVHQQQEQQQQQQQQGEEEEEDGVEDDPLSPTAAGSSSSSLSAVTTTTVPAEGEEEEEEEEYASDKLDKFDKPDGDTSEAVRLEMARTERGWEGEAGEPSEGASDSNEDVAVQSNAQNAEAGQNEAQVSATASAAAAAAVQAEEEEEKEEKTAATKHAQAWVAVVDLCAARLGPRLAGEVLLPPVLAALERIRSPECACRLMDSCLWGVLVRRIGNGPFLRRAFPFLLTWLDRGLEGEVLEDVNAGLCWRKHEGETKPTTAPTASPARANGESVGGPETGVFFREGGGVEEIDADADADADDAASSKVQVAAAASISCEVYECLGPTLASRYLVPALVDCLERLATTAAASASYSVMTPTPSRPRSPATESTASASMLAPENSTSKVDGCKMLPGASPGRRRRRVWVRDLSGGDPASRALLRYCRRRGRVDGTGVKDNDAGAGGGAPFLLLSQALGDMCSRIGTEEATVPLVLSRLFDQILPTLEPVLEQQGGPSSSATGFRSVLEATSLLGRLLPSLCPETVSHFYVGLRPASLSTAFDTAASLAVPRKERGENKGAGPSPVVGRDRRYRARPWLEEEEEGGQEKVEEVTSVPWFLSSIPLPQPVGGVDLPWSVDGRAEASFFSSDDGGDDRGGGSFPDEDGEGPSRREKVGGGGTVLEEEVAEGGRGGGRGGRGGDVFVSSTRGDERGEAEAADVSLRFVCHVEAARLLAATAMRVVEEERGEWEEEKRRVLQAGEAFFAAFGRSYGGLVFSSPTMVAALMLAREVHSPLASLFGFDTMHERVPSASRRIVEWLSKNLARNRSGKRRYAAPRDGFGALGNNVGGVDLPTRIYISYCAGSAVASDTMKSASSPEEGRSPSPSPNGALAPCAERRVDSHVDRGRRRDFSQCSEEDRREGGDHKDTQRRPSDYGIYISSSDTSPRDSGLPWGEAAFDGGGGGTATGVVHFSPPPGSCPTMAVEDLSEGAALPLPRRGCSDAAERGDGGQGGTTPPLFGRLQQAMKNFSLLEGPGSGGSSERRHRAAGPAASPGKADTAATFFNGGRNTNKNNNNKSNSNREKSPGGVRSRLEGGFSRSPFGNPPADDPAERRAEAVVAWQSGSTGVLDPLLPPPSSAMPPPVVSPRRRRDEGIGGDGRAAAGGGRSAGVEDPRAGRSWNFARAGSPSGAGGGRGQGSVEDDAFALEWPSLLGAIGSKAPRAPSPAPSPAVAAAAAVSAAASVVQGTSALSSRASPIRPTDTAGGASDDRGAASVTRSIREEIAAAAAITNVAKAASAALPLSSSPPRPPFLQPQRPPSGEATAVPSPVPHQPPLPVSTHFSRSSVPAPLPGTCRGVGVEVGYRLRQRAWLTGRRTWGVSGGSGGEGEGTGAGRKSGRALLGEGFDRDAVGSLFPLSMVLQTSFVAHPDNAAVTSMAVDKPSESILLTGSSDGEVRVWSLRDDPIAHVSGFRCGESSTAAGGTEAGGGGGGRHGSGGARAAARAAVTQLGLFEGGGRAAALDGLVRVWDVERSKGLALCHQGSSVDAPPLTAFCIAGCGDETTPPLHESEWEALAPGAVDGSDYAPSAADDQQLSATYEGGVVHYDCRQGLLGGAIQSLAPVAQWDVEARLESLRARSPTRGHTHGSRGDSTGSARRGDPPPLPLGLCSACEGEGAWLAAGSGAGQVVVLDKRRAGGRPLFWWNAHDSAVVGVFHVARHLLLTVARDHTAVLWDLSRSPAETAGVDSTGPSVRHNHHHHRLPNGRRGMAGVYGDEAQAFSISAGYGEISPVRVSTAFGLPDGGPGMCPSTVVMASLARPPPCPRRAWDDQYARGAATINSGKFSMLGGGEGAGGVEPERLPVLFAAAGQRMVASVVRQEAGVREEVHPAGFVGPSGTRVNGRNGGRRSSSSGGGLVVRSAAVLPLRRLVLLGCSDGWVRVGT